MRTSLLISELVANKEDKIAAYRKVAQIHSLCINQGFLPTLGIRFLTLLYEAIDADQNSVLFVNIIDGEIVGFVAGGRGMKSIYIEMIKRFPKLLIALIPVVFSPSKLKYIVDILLIGREKNTAANRPTAELFSIAVLDNARGRGIAGDLYKSLAQHFTENCEDSFGIVVGDNLLSAHKFYLRMGAIPVAQISIHKGQISTLYKQDL